MKLSILFEDDFLIAINKQPGTAVIPGRGLEKEDTLVFAVEAYLGKKVFIVHRLDKETSGVILFAKDPDTHRMLNLQFESRMIEKIYLALVNGNVEKSQIIDKHLRQFGSGRMGIDERGKRSVTEFTIKEHLRNSTLLEVAPKTGRRHQIRVHLYSIGHPILGDPLYGDKLPVGGFPRLMLHAGSINFRHPGGQIQQITAVTDDLWNSILSSLKA